jgi:hypothetical protein
MMPILDLERPVVGAAACSAIAANPGRFDHFVGQAREAGIQSARLAGVAPGAHLREVTRRAVRNLARATLDLVLKYLDLLEKLSD